MTGATLQPNRWYWIRRADGSLEPYCFDQLRHVAGQVQPTAEFFVGGMIQHWPLGSVVGEAHMPDWEPPPDHDNNDHANDHDANDDDN